MKRNQDKQGKNIKVLISTEQVDRLELCEITSTEADCIHLGKKRAVFRGNYFSSSIFCSNLFFCFSDNFFPVISDIFFSPVVLLLLAHTPSSTFYRTGSTEYGKLAMFASIKSSTQCGCDCFRCSLNSGKKD